MIENIKKFRIPGVRFIRWGEPTLHPDYIGIVKRAKEAGALVHINTNGFTMDEAQIKALIEAGLDSIKFSFQGADAGTYSQMREGGDYNKLLNVVRKMYEIRGSLSYPYIQVSTTLTSETAKQVEQFKREISRCCDYCNIGYTKLAHLDIDSMNISDEEKKEISELKEHEAISHTYRDFCPEAFDKLSINWNGDVTLCCADYDNFMIIGNILDNDLRQIFTSKAAEFYRDIIIKKQYGRIRCCKYCYETVPLQK